MRATDLEVCGRRYRALATESFLDALFGVRAVRPDTEAVVIRGSSVHAFISRRSMWVTGLDDQGRSLGWRRLRPMRVVRFPGAAAVVEFPLGLECEDRHQSHTVRRHG